MGVAAGAVAFLFWCEQSGFYGGLRDRGTGKSASNRTVQLSAGVAYSCFYVPASTFGAGTSLSDIVTHAERDAAPP
ncbi:hypothetical protein Ade02nite_46270 [Paractinoplanes deccanensis]|uniref:Uncharacterized protein n=1 Tax=Paractinoplanes deccanensis TaxID=113561 RepID=A0ABQ3Y7L0_9ACTN|nr:hypothetical protein Ade02nite_46270 [Actinoplanes deccanensis]